MITIQGHLTGLNEYTRLCRASKFAGNNVKKENEKIIAEAINKAIDEAEQTPVPDDAYPIAPVIIWYDDTRRDFDNIVFAKKFIFDALQKCGIIKNDGRKCISGATDQLITDKENPRIEIYLTGGGSEWKLMK